MWLSFNIKFANFFLSKSPWRCTFFKGSCRCVFILRFIRVCSQTNYPVFDVIEMTYFLFYISVRKEVSNGDFTPLHSFRLYFVLKSWYVKNTSNKIIRRYFMKVNVFWLQRFCFSFFSVCSPKETTLIRGDMFGRDSVSSVIRTAMQQMDSVRLIEGIGRIAIPEPFTTRKSTIHLEGRLDKRILSRYAFICNLTERVLEGSQA